MERKIIEKIKNEKFKKNFIKIQFKMELVKMITVTNEEEEIITSIFNLPQRLYRSYYACIDRFEIYDEDENTPETDMLTDSEKDNIKSLKDKKEHTSPPKKVYLLLHYVESKLSELYQNEREFFFEPKG